MSERRIKVTVYYMLALHDRETKAFLQETYLGVDFYFTLPNAPVNAEPQDLVTDQMIHERQTQFFEKQEALPDLKAKYPALPDFYIGRGRLATQKVFFEDA